MKLGSVLTQTSERLLGVSDTPRLDAQVVLARVLGRPRAWVLAHPEAELSSGEARRLEEALARLETGEPLPYVLGLWEFFGLDFTVTPEVLIPRPETELLVEQALAWVKRQGKKSLAADVGTGSGCIAISLAVNDSQLQVVATDLSLPALHVTRANAVRHAVVERVHLLQCNLLSPFPCDALYRHSPFPLFNLICANLPYIPEKTLEGLRVARWEPRGALYGGRDGLDWIRALIQQAPSRLSPEGLLLMEIEASQGEAAGSLAQEAFPQGEVQVLRDLGGHDRVVAVRPPTR
jgi:release factor glutamine methyltransferase